MTKKPDVRLSTRDVLILGVLADGPLHGYGLVKAIERESEGTVLLDPANLYRSLGRMREWNWIAEVSPSGYTRRRTYGITPQGREVLTVELQRLAHMVERFSSSETGAS